MIPLNGIGLQCIGIFSELYIYVLMHVMIVSTLPVMEPERIARASRSRGAQPRALRSGQDQVAHLMEGLALRARGLLT
jgi:hypothetical protein